LLVKGQVECKASELELCKMSSVGRLVVVSLKKYKWQTAAILCFLILFTHTLLSPASFTHFQVI
jgi:hypothetical protein